MKLSVDIQRSRVMSDSMNVLSEVATAPPASGAMRSGDSAAQATKAAILRNMNHEMRTPLNAVIGFAELIITQPFGPVPERYVGYASEIQDAAKHLLMLINDMLDLARVESGARALNETEVDLGRMANEAVELTSPLAAGRGVILTALLSGPSARVRADRAALLRILLTLLTHAVQSTPPGGTVAVRHEGDAERGCLVEVIDSSIDEPAAAIEALLDPFRPVDTSSVRQVGTVPLGLALARALTALHGGTMTIIDRIDAPGRIARVSFPRARRVGDA
jgi:signal transduction histidine kinase